MILKLSSSFSFFSLSKSSTSEASLTHCQARADAGELCQLTGHGVHLNAQLSGRHQNQHSRHLSLSWLVDQTLQNRQHEGCSLP